MFLPFLKEYLSCASDCHHFSVGYIGPKRLLRFRKSVIISANMRKESQPPQQKRYNIRKTTVHLTWIPFAKYGMIENCLNVYRLKNSSFLRYALCLAAQNDIQ